jgi:hypothetical protein
MTRFQYRAIMAKAVATNAKRDGRERFGDALDEAA